MKTAVILIFVFCILMLRSEPMQQQSPLSDIWIGMSKESALTELRKNYQIGPAPGVRSADAYHLSGRHGEGQIVFVEDRVAAVSQYVGPVYSDRSTVTFARDLYRLLKTSSDTGPERARSRTLDVRLTEGDTPGFGRFEDMSFVIGPGKQIKVSLVLPDNPRQGSQSVTLSSLRSQP
jgi:hypothetical protein